MKRILVTGADGQLGLALKEQSHRFDRFSYTFLDIHDLDLTDESRVRLFFEQNYTDYVINCAAYTAVDQAEKQSDQAFSVNAGIPELLGSICLKKSIYFLHLSTDYVYNGKTYLPHLELEEPDTVSVYAASKLKGEMSLWNNPRSIIIRTSWLYSEYGRNFLRNMIRLSKERNEIGVVYDQVGTPTYAGDLAEVLLKIIMFSEKNGFKPGIYNYSNEGVCSWYDFAVEIMQLTRRNCTIRPIRTSEYPLPATRPEYAVMDKSKIKSTFGLAISHWKQGVLKAVNNLERNKEI